MITDPIADYLTRIRNAMKAGAKVVEIPASNVKKRITEILYNNGYILKYKFDDVAGNQGVIKIALKYDKETDQSALRKLIKISKPGLRIYSRADKLPRVINGLGIAIVSTSQGIMSDKEARTKNIGGEVLCYVY